MFLNSTTKLLDAVMQNFTLKRAYVLIWYCQWLSLVDEKYAAVREDTWVKGRRQAPWNVTP